MATEANKTRLGTTKSDEAAYENALLKDPRLDLMKRVVMNCCILITILAFQYVLLAMACLMFNYSSKTHLVLFGLISSMQLVCAPLGYYGIKTGNRLYLMVMAVVNTVWMVSTLVFIIVYMIMSDNDYKNEVALHVGMFVFLCASITLLIASFFLMRRLHMVRLELSTTPVALSADGKLKSKKSVKTIPTNK